ncbi:MAG: hypothetical protein V4579_11565, partial [Pseudomonadota bacterium]
GIGAHPLLTAFGAPVPSGSMVAGRIYTATFINSGVNTSFKVHGNFDDAYNIPLGGLLWSTNPSPPNSSFVAPSGQCISATTYATYWAMVGSPGSGVCSGGEFQILDIRGRAPVALDTLNGVAANRLTSSSAGCGTAMTSVGSVCALASQTSSLTTSNLPPYTPVGTISNVLGGSFTQGLRLTGSLVAYGGAASGAAPGDIVVSSTFTGTPQGGASQGFSNVMPVVGLMPYLRIL